jgi:alanyl-tRNA synthetase
MTDRLYYHDSFLYDFEAEVSEVLNSPRPALILDRTAFYPTSGGQVFDMGWITSDANTKLRVTEVADTEDGKVIHYLEATKDLQPGARVHGQIDATRRRDHMQQHSGQHVLSAAFLRLHNLPTVSFHMADDYCSIDLDTPTLTQKQIESAERLANEIILENRPSTSVSSPARKPASWACAKFPPPIRDELRIIDIRDWDLSACGGTHVAQTGQIASVLLRKAEKVRQGWRVEFVAGQRAVATARRDFTALTETAALFSAHIYDVPQQAQKSLDELRSWRKQWEHSQEELAAAQAAALLAETPEIKGRKIVVHARRSRNKLREIAGSETHPAFSQRRRPAGHDFAATVARIRAVRRPALRHGRAHERDYDEAGRARRRQQGSGARRPHQRRRHRCRSRSAGREARSLTGRLARLGKGMSSETEEKLGIRHEREGHKFHSCR